MKSPPSRWISVFFVMLVCCCLLLADGIIRSKAKEKSSLSSVSFTISGNVQADGVNLPGATLVLSGAASATTTTDASGNYSFTANAGGNYVVTVYKSGYVFTPTNQTFNSLNNNQVANFLSGVPLCTPLPSGLVAWYRAEDNATDASGNGNNASLQNGATFSNGRVGRNFLLDGVNDYVDIPDVPSVSPTTAVSLQAWIKPHSVGTGQAIISNLNASTDNGTFHFVLSANGSLQFNVQQSTTVFRSASTNPSVIAASVYAHVAATFDTSTQAIKIYVNGVDMPTTISGSNVTSLFDVATHPRIGAYTITGTFGAPFNGEIDEAQIYNRALSAVEVQTNYNAGSAGICQVSTPARAGGSLDLSFGAGGKVTTPIGSGNDNAYAEAIQADGKIVVAGSSNNGSNLDFALARYKIDGTLDSSFGVGGKVTTPIGSANEEAYGLAVQGDGKIVAVGYSFNGFDDDLAVVRYNGDGSLDGSFGAGGKAITDILGMGKDNDAYAVSIQADGKIVIAGSTNVAGSGSNSARYFAIARYNANGTLDSSFGSAAGSVILQLSSFVLVSFPVDIADAIAIQADNKIVVAGYSFNGTNYDFALARFNTNGSADTSFDADGKLTTAIGSADDSAYALAIQADGKIVASGSSSNGSNADFATVRYNTNGSLDSTFNSTGKITTAIGSGDDIASAVAIQADGGIVAAGRSVSNSNADFAVVRYNTNGSLDTSFNSTGKVTNAIGSGDDRANALAIQGDGKLVVAGYSFNGSNNDFALIRYNANGTNITVAPASNLSVFFNNLTQSGDTVATPLTASQLPPLPQGYALPTNVLAYDIRTAASYTGNITVTFNVGNIGSAVTCDQLRSLHFENGAWTPAANPTTIYNGSSLTCAVAQTVTSLSPFVVAQLSAPVAQALQFSQANYNVNENGAQGALTVNRIGGSTGTVTVDYTTGDGSAVAGSDYTITSGTFTFNPGEVSKTVVVPILDDTIYEGNETLNVVLSNATGGAVVGSPGTATLAILDNETQPTISINDLSVTEPLSGTTTATFTVSLSGASAQSISVNYATANNSAVAPGDYVAIPTTTLTFSPGQTTKTINVTVNADAVTEPLESYFVNLTNPTNATIADSQGVGSIRQQYGNGKIAFQSNRTGNNEIYLMNADGTGVVNLTNNAVSGGDEDTEPSFAPDGARIVFVSNLSGGVSNLWSMNADGTNRIHLTTGALTDHAPSWSQDGTKLTFTSNQSTGAVGIWKANADGTNRVELSAVSGETAVEPSWSPDGNKIVFAGNRAGNYEIYVMNADGSGLVPVTNNSAVDSHPKWSPDGSKILFWTNRDGHGEIYVMNSDGTGQTRITTGTAANDTAAWSPDGARIVFRSNRDGNTEIYVMNSDGSSQTRLTNNALTDDNPCWQPVAANPGALQFSSATFSVIENGGSATITVTRTGGSGDAVTVNYATSNNTATAGSDYTATSGALTWNAGESGAKAFIVPILDNGLPESNETVNLTLANPTNGAALGAQSNAVLTIVDNDVPGQLDVGFGGSGKVTTPIGSALDQITSIALQADGKIVVAGDTYNGSNYDFGLARYNNDGTLDSSFGTGGIVTTAFGSSHDDPAAIVIQPDGRIVVAGYTSDGSHYRFALVRYNSDGTLDSSFGTNGKVTGAAIATDDYVHAAALQPDGKIIVGGTVWNGSQYNFAVARYNPNGTLDAGFGSGGVVTNDVTSDETFRALLIQADGKIVGVGYSTGDFALFRYNSNGSLDTSFGTGGKVITSFSSGSDLAYSAALQPDGRILAAGFGTIGSNNDFALARYNTDGSLDSAFGTAGKVTTPIGGAADVAYSMAFQADGKIVLAGTSSNGSNNDFAVARYNSNGSLDPSFNGTGKATTAIGGADDVAYAVAIQSDGKIVAAGYSNNGSNDDFALVRYNGDYIAPTLQFSAPVYSAAENSGSATITVLRTGDASSAATVNYATSDGTATAGSDYTATSGTLTFSPGEVLKTFSITIQNDAVNEGNETVNLTLTNPTGPTLGTPSTAILGINDRPPNDNFVNSQFISGATGGVTGTLVNATKEAGEPSHAGLDGHTSIWYRWTAPSSGTVFFDTNGSESDPRFGLSPPDTLLAVYTGNSVNALTPVAGNDDASSSVKTSALSFNATAGTEYRIAVDAFRGDVGYFGTTVLSWSIGSRISGRLTLNTPTGPPASGRQILLSGSASRQTTTDSNGYYAFDGLPVGGNYTVSGDGSAEFIPTQLSYTALSGIVNDGNLVERGSGIQSGSISGKVHLSNGVGVSGVRVNLNSDSGPGRSALTGSDGSFIFASLPVSGTYEVVPDPQAGGFIYTYSPTSVSNLAGSSNHLGLNFTVASQQAVYDIGGQVRDGLGQPISNVMLTLGGGSAAQTQSDASGNYSFSNLSPGVNYSVSASKTAYVFAPPSAAVPNLNANQKTVDFAATAIRTLTVASSNPANGVNVTVTPNDNNASGNGSTQFTRVYNLNTSVSLTAPATAGGNNFQKWLKDGADFANNTLANVNVTLDADHTMTAVYVAPTPTLTVVSSNPNSGVNITVTPNDNNASGNGSTQFTRVYNLNTSVSLTAPATAGGNNFQKWLKDGADFANNTLANVNVTLDADHTMTAVYVAPTPTLTVVSSNPNSGVNITVTPNDNNASGNGSTQFTRVYNLNTSVSLTAPATAGGNNFQKWLKDGADFANNTLANVNVTLDADHTMTAVYVAPTPTLTVVSSNPNSGVNITVTPNDNNASGNGSTQFTRVYNLNTSVSLTAPATAGGNNFQKWLKDGADFTNNTLANVSVTLNADHTMTAVYVTPTWTLTVASSNPNSGVNITVSPNDNNGAGNGTTQFSRTYNDGQVVNLTAPATAGGKTFQKWQRDGVDFTTSLTAMLTLGANNTLTASFLTPALQIDSVALPAGRTSGGQQIIFTGAFANLSTVQVGGVAASWLYTNGAGDTTKITVTTPAHDAGAVQIDLAPTSGTAYSKTNAFAYLPTIFTDNTLGVGQTTAKAQHIIELRQAVDAMRAVAGLSGAPWTDPALAAGSRIKAIHILELRTYLDDAATRLGYSTSPYTDPSLTTGYSIKRIHIEELRQRIRVIAG